MCALAYSTADTSTAAVRSLTAATSRSANVAAGCAATFTTSIPSSARRSSWRRIVWNSPSVVTSRGRWRSGSAAPGADGALDHLHVPVPPLLEAFVQVHQPLADLRGDGIASVHVD